MFYEKSLERIDLLITLTLERVYKSYYYYEMRNDVL